MASSSFGKNDSDEAAAETGRLTEHELDNPHAQPVLGEVTQEKSTQHLEEISQETDHKASEEFSQHVYDPEETIAKNEQHSPNTDKHSPTTKEAEGSEPVSSEETSVEKSVQKAHQFQEVAESTGECFQLSKPNKESAVANVSSEMILEDEAQQQIAEAPEKAACESEKKRAVVVVVEDTEAAPETGGILGIRHLVIFLMFLSLVVAYALRVDMSIAIVAMADEDSVWSAKKALILSSFFMGYVVTQVPGGLLAQRFGARWLLLGAVFVASVFTLLTQIAANLGWEWLVASRVIQGLGQGAIFPSLHTLLTKWAPIEEKGRLATFVYAGAQVGTIIGMSISGGLASTVGWKWIFYIFGAVGILWCILWFPLGASTPSEHKLISKTEHDYINNSLGNTDPNVKLHTPWKDIFTSLPMWSLIIVHCGHNWGFWTLLTLIPSYMNKALNYDLTNNGLLSALPYLVMWLLSFVFSFISDFITTRKLIPLHVSRKIFNSIGHWFPAITLICLKFVKEGDQTLPVTLLTVAVGLNAATYVGFQVNHIDLSPNFAGTLMGITNCAANIMSIIGPLIAGRIVQDETSQDEWQIVFYVTAGFYIIGNLLFVLFGKADIQPWNTPKETNEE